MKQFKVIVKSKIQITAELKINCCISKFEKHAEVVFTLLRNLHASCVKKYLTESEEFKSEMMQINILFQKYVINVKLSKVKAHLAESHNYSNICQILNKSEFEYNSIMTDRDFNDSEFFETCCSLKNSSDVRLKSEVC